MTEGYTMTKPYTLTCPECGGALFPPEQAPFPQYVCHIGHRLSWPTMLASQQSRIEGALGTAMAVIKERSELCRQLAERGEIDPSTSAAMIQEADARAIEVKTLLEAGWKLIPRAQNTGGL